MAVSLAGIAVLEHLLYERNLDGTSRPGRGFCALESRGDLPRGSLRALWRWDDERPRTTGYGSLQAAPRPLLLRPRFPFASGRGRGQAPAGLDGRRESASIICGPCHR